MQGMAALVHAGAVHELIVPPNPACLHCQVAADGAGLRLQRVGGADDLASRLDHALALPHLRGRAGLEQAGFSGLLRHATLSQACWFGALEPLQQTKINTRSLTMPTTGPDRM